MSCRISPSTGKYGPEKTQYMDTFHVVGLVSRFRSISLPGYRVKNNLSLEVTYFSPVLHFISKRINLQGKSNLVSLWNGPLVWNRLKRFSKLLRTCKQTELTHFSPVLCFIYKTVICFAEQNQWLVSIWNTTLGWNGSVKVLTKIIFRKVYLWHPLYLNCE